MTYAEFVLKAALNYVVEGYRIFPVDVGTKAPLVSGGFYAATLDSKMIEEWFVTWPNAGIGLPTGLNNGLFVLDVDERSDGFASLKRLVEEHGSLPHTPVSLTQNDGLHYFFAYPDTQLPTTKIGDGLDIKSDGGYVVVPPSALAGGRGYRWQPGDHIKRPLPQAPPWLLSLIQDEKQKQEDNWDPGALVYPEGMRENTLIKFVGLLIRKGASPEAILDFIQAENKIRCRPPLPSVDVESFVERLTGRYKSLPDHSLGVQPNELRPKGWGSPAELRGVLKASAGHVDELIEGIVGKGSVTILAASWKSGKTLITYRLILDALQGHPVFGIYPTARPLKILMLQFEMPTPEDERRYRRLTIGSGVSPEHFVKAVEDGRYMHFSRPSSNLARADLAMEFKKFVLANDFDLVVIDSLTAAFAPEDLNNNSLARHLFTQAFSSITSAGKSILLIHHKKKKQQQQKGAPPEDGKGSVLGAQAWGAAADRTLGLENIPRKSGENCGPGEFKVRLEVLGSWTPTDVDGLTLTIRDDGDGTVFETSDVVTPHETSKVEDAARDLGDFISGTRKALLPDAIKHLQLLGYSRRTRNHAKGIAVSRGWIVEPVKEFGKVQVIIKGPNWLR